MCVLPPLSVSYSGTEADVCALYICVYVSSYYFVFCVHIVSAVALQINVDLACSRKRCLVYCVSMGCAFYGGTWVYFESIQ